MAIEEIVNNAKKKSWLFNTRGHDGYFSTT